MNRFYSIAVCIFIFVLFSCDSNKNESNQKLSEHPLDSIVTIPKENFEKGKVLENIHCKNDDSQSFALYLPSKYSVEKLFPIVYAFDPHGTGKLPVSMYYDLAERYGFILVGSNNSKNGNSWEESAAIAEKLFADVQNRLSINTSRIYLMGFSGGARVANGITISNGIISGVICCGAVAPATNSSVLRSNYSLIGIVGTSDFNYIEMKKYVMVDLAGHSIKNVVTTFDGKHEWCPKESMDEAFWWLELCEMRKNSTYKNDSLVKNRITPWLSKIDSLMKQKMVFESYNLCKKTITFYDGLIDLTSCFKMYKSFQENNEIDKSLNDESVMWEKESQLKQYYLQGFQKNNFGWWQKEISELNKKIKLKNSETMMHKRVLGYLSLVAYMQASGALKQNAIPEADYFCKIYVLVDATNSEAYYLTASVNAKLKNEKLVIESLNTALNNGFDDLSRLKNDASFSEMVNNSDFQAIINKLETPKQ